MFLCGWLVAIDRYLNHLKWINPRRWRRRRRWWLISGDRGTTADTDSYVKVVNGGGGKPKSRFGQQQQQQQQPPPLLWPGWNSCVDRGSRLDRGVKCYIACSQQPWRVILQKNSGALTRTTIVAVQQHTWVKSLSEDQWRRLLWLIPCRSNSERFVIANSDRPVEISEIPVKKKRNII